MQIALIAVLVIAVALGMVWRFQEKILFQPPGNISADAASAKRVEFAAADGQKLFGFLVGDPTADIVVLAFHGNADLAVWQLDWAAAIRKRFSVSIFVAEYRGYGGLSGASTYETSKLDSEAAYLALTVTHGVSTSRIVVYGHSLGSAIAAELAVRHPVQALLFQSPFTSAREMARLTFARPMDPVWRFVSRIHFDTIAAVRDLDVPVSVIHGTSDLVVPTRMGKTVFQAARNKAEFRLVEKAGHNNVVEVAGEEYWDWFGAALSGAVTESEDP